MNGRVYIEKTACISLQDSFGGSFMHGNVRTTSPGRENCSEPDYSELIDIRQIRRMSRIVRMSVAAGKTVMSGASKPMPDGIIVGTAMGCMDDTDNFLTKLVEQKEEMLSPTSFIHSTHNTIASQIALQFKCYGYNSTYVHKSHSFEGALIDAMLLISENPEHLLVVGGADETIDHSYTIMERLGVAGNEIITGEGVAFFALSGNHENALCEIKSADTWTFNESGEVIRGISDRIKNGELPAPSLVLAGINGDQVNDDLINQSIKNISGNTPVIPYKKYCGEFGTASAFALWLASEIIRTGKLPPADGMEIAAPVNNIMIFDQKGKTHHSMMMISAC